MINLKCVCKCACFVPGQRSGMHAVGDKVVAERERVLLMGMAHSRKSVCNAQRSHTMQRA